jgi:deoxyribonuclease V
LHPALEKRFFRAQKKIASRVVPEDRFSTRAVAGVDQDFLGEMVISGALVLAEGGPLCKSGYLMKARLPYIPGLLSFREGPAAINAVRTLGTRPSLLFVDGCGINHPRRAGLASYLGVMLDIPTIGISKRVLCGDFRTPIEEGDAEPLVYENEVVGNVLKSKAGCRPIVVAPGNRVSIESSLELARAHLKGHKLPEPCRLAHQHARQVKELISRSAEASLSACDPRQSRPAPF